MLLLSGAVFVGLITGGAALTHAIAFIAPNTNTPSGRRSAVVGVVNITQQEGKPAVFRIILKGLVPKTLHGFHVHEFGDIHTKGCQSTGSHYNPFHKQHGAPTDANRHAGDLGNVVSNGEGKIKMTLVDNQAVLLGKYTIIGRAFVIHQKEDDLGKGHGSAEAESKKTGNAGARLGCGIITHVP